MAVKPPKSDRKYNENRHNNCWGLNAISAKLITGTDKVDCLHDLPQQAQRINRPARDS
jgi:hypothetical protein